MPSTNLLTDHEVPSKVPHRETGATRQSLDAPRSIGRVLNVLETLAEFRGGASLTEIAQALGMPKSSLLVLLKALVASRHLSVSDQRYRLGEAAFDLGQKILGARSSTVLLRQALGELANRTQETAVLTGFDPHMRVVSYIDAVESPQTVRYAVALGLIRQLYCTAAGQVTLAYQSDEYRDTYLRTNRFQQLTPNTVTDPGKIRERLARIRAQGYAVSVEESIPGASGIAAPIIIPGQPIDRALLVAGPVARLAAHTDEIVAAVVELAARASQQLAHTR